jgi:hypothetical protein
MRGSLGLGQAVGLQPDRREAYFYIANHWAGKGNWIKTYGAARSGLYDTRIAPKAPLLEL